MTMSVLGGETGRSSPFVNANLHLDESLLSHPEADGRILPA